VLSHPGSEAPLVLVIDPDSRVREQMYRVLRGAGYRVAVAESSPEALRLARTLRPAAITLDLMIPGLDGWAVLTALKSDPDLAAIPLLILRFICDRNLAFTLDVCDFVIKPAIADHLEAVLNRHCGSGDDPVLIVDEGPAMRQLLRRSAESLGYCARTAANGIEALRVTSVRPPRLILVDPTVPELDYEILESLRNTAAWNPAPVVLLLPLDLSLEQRRRLDRLLHQSLPKCGLRGDELIEHVTARIAATPNTPSHITLG
jgi:CheY-like chemotaxis protein